MNVSSGNWFRLGGLVIAIIAFGITRIFVAEAVQFQGAESYFLGGLIPLGIGLGVTVYGVALGIGNFPGEYVNTVTRWMLLGIVGASAILIVTTVDPLLHGEGLQTLIDSSLLVANVLLGGMVAGILVGTRTALNQEQRRQITRQANQSRFLTRLLRHEVLNAVTMIQGYAELLGSSDRSRKQPISIIETASKRIAQAIETVDDLNFDEDDARYIDIQPVLEREVKSALSRFSDMSFEYDGSSDDVSVIADGRLGLIFKELLNNAGEAPEADRATITVEERSYNIRITVSDNGTGLPRTQQEMLTSGEFPEFDDPSIGFGLQIVRLLVRQHGGELSVENGANGSGTEITITLPRAGAEHGVGKSISVSPAQLIFGSVSGLLAGVVMGLFFALTADVLPIIGALYGTANPTIGWVTHLFHSVVFALIFVAMSSQPTVEHYLDDWWDFGIAGVVWGAVLWIGAAGVIMPLWLQFVGVPSPLPNLPQLGFVSHALWGSVLGVTYGLLRNREILFWS